MRALLLAVIGTCGRYTALLLVGAAGLLFLGWLALLDYQPLYALVALPLVLPVAIASISLLVGTIFAGLKSAGGHFVSPQDAPELWSIWTELSPPRLGERRRIAIDDRFNASISERFRFLGLFMPEVTLSLGLPLLKALDVATVKTIVAHEVGHQACKHTKGLSNLVEFEMALATVFDTFPPERSIAGAVIFAVVGWMGKALTQAELKLSRRTELEADAMAVRHFGAEVVARSLSMTAAHGMLYRVRYIEPVVDGLEKLVHVPSNPLENYLAAPAFAPEEIEACARTSYAEKPDPQSTHPGLAERLAAAGYPDLPPLQPLDGSAMRLLPPEVVADVLAISREAWKRYVTTRLRLD